MVELKDKDLARFGGKYKAISTLDCWEWTCGKDNYGYGMFWFGGTNIHASRFALFVKTGKWPSLNVCHKCDNPGCVNPDHLFESTQKENVLDSIRKGRRIRNRHVISEKEAKEVLRLLSQGETARKIAEEVGVTKHIVYDIKSGRTWRGVA